MDESSPVDALNSLVDAYRVRSLWFLRPDYYPTTREEGLRVLDWIQRHGDREGFQKAVELRQWLLRSSSGASAGS